MDFDLDYILSLKKEQILSVSIRVDKSELICTYKIGSVTYYAYKDIRDLSIGEIFKLTAKILKEDEENE